MTPLALASTTTNHVLTPALSPLRGEGEHIGSLHISIRFRTTDNRMPLAYRGLPPSSS